MRERERTDHRQDRQGTWKTRGESTGISKQKPWPLTLPALNSVMKLRTVVPALTLGCKENPERLVGSQ